MEGFGFTADTERDAATYAVVLSNPNVTWVPTSVRVNVTFFDANGTVLDTSPNFITGILPGIEAAVAGFAFDAGEATEMDVQVSHLSESDWVEIEEGAHGNYRYERVETVRDDFGGMKTTGLVISEFTSDQSNFAVAAVYYNSAGEIVGGAPTYIDQLLSGEQAAFEATMFVPLADVAETRVFADISRGG